MTRCPEQFYLGKQTIFLGEMGETIGCKRNPGHKGPCDVLVPPGVIIRGKKGSVWRIKL